MPDVDQSTFDLLRLTLVPGLGPILINRCLLAFGSASASLAAAPGALANIRGIGPEKARAISRELPATAETATREVERAASLGVHLVSAVDPGYPPLLRQIPDPPPILYVRGRILPESEDRYPVAIVGSRSCTHYGREQAERFAGALAESGLTVVSGGARGIDTAAHRAALRIGGRTIAVLGCGLSHAYPPDNAALFDEIAQGDRGAVVSELPLDTHPSAENFPARNRIISGLALAVLVIEAGRRSGALITARAANEDHGREVFALPGRVDSPASEGTIELLKQGAAGIASSPKDIIDALESRARHHHAGTFGSVSIDPSREPGFFDERAPTRQERAITPVLPALTDTQRAIVDSLMEPRTVDELVRSTGLDAARVMSDVTVLEIKRLITRQGTRLSRASGPPRL